MIFCPTPWEIKIQNNYLNGEKFLISALIFRSDIHSPASFGIEVVNLELRNR